MESIQIHDKSFVPYLKHDELQEIVKNLAEKVYEDYKDETPVFIGVQNGVIMFFSDFLLYLLKIEASEFSDFIFEMDFNE